MPSGPLLMHGAVAEPMNGGVPLRLCYEETRKGGSMGKPAETGYAPVNGVEIYWERYGSGGTPVVVSHGGFGLISMFGSLLDTLSERRQVVAIELQGHGHTRDVDRPFSYEAFGDDIAGVVRCFGYEQADLVGDSLGAAASLRTAIQHPDVVRKLVLVSIPVRHEGWFPEVRAGMDQVGSGFFEHMKHSPMYAGWREVAPDGASFPTLMDKTGELIQRDYDWSDEIGKITAQTMLVYGDADSIPLSHAAEFYALLGGGLRDADWDGSGKGQARLAVLPDLTHYDIFQSPRLAEVVDEFLG